MRYVRRWALTCLFSILVPVQSIAASVSDRDLAKIWQRGDVPQMQQLAEAGDVRAQHWMGIMLQNRGRFDEAIEWYARAVDQGDAKSANSIAFFYAHGIGRPKDPKEALAWHRKGAQLGDFWSQVSYAAALRSGDVLAQDHREAFKWYARAAAQRGYGQRGYAFLPLAEMYETGTGVPRDLSRAYAFAKAAELTVDDSDTANQSKARSLRERAAARLQPANLAAGEQLFEALVADAPGRGTRRSGLSTDTLLLFSILGAGILIWGWLRRAARQSDG